MLKQKLQEVFNEPGCKTNQAKNTDDRRKGCARKTLVPGAAAGGCAFDGAKVALQPITDAAHLVHGPIACEGNSWDSRHSFSSGPMLYRIGMTTDLQELDVIHGGEKKLYRAIGEIIERFDPPAVFVYQTCVPALIGDDLVKVCARAAEAFGKPVIPVNAPGFVGSKNLGNKLGGEALLDHVIGTREPETSTPCDINVLGEYNVAGELWQVKPLLTRLGVRILASITGDGRYADVCTAHRARLNMMVCSQALITLARKMEERWGIPYFEGSFYGIGDTSSALRTIARRLVESGAPADLVSRTEALIAEEEARAWARLAKFRPALESKRVLLYTGGVKSWSVISALQEVGMKVIGTSVRKSTEDDKKRARELLGEDALLFDQIPPREMYRMLKDGEADILMSGGRTQFVALKAKVPWLDINQERHHPFAGYDGMVNLVRAIHGEITNPVWAAVRRPAPWEGQPQRGRNIP